MKKIIVFIAGMLFAYSAIYRNIKIDSIEDNIITLDIYGVLHCYYYESEE